MNGRSRLLRIAALSGLVVLLVGALGACAGGDDETTAPAPAAPAPAAPAAAAAEPAAEPAATGSAAAAEAPQAGGILRIASTVDFFDFDMSYVGGSLPNGRAYARAYEGILGFEYGPEVGYTTMNPTPELAESWSVSPDSKTFTFNVRSGIKFANIAPVNGRELTAEDVAWSFRYWSRFGPEFTELRTAQFGYLFQDPVRIEATGPSSVDIEFESAFSPFLNYASTDYLNIVPRDIFDADGHLKDQVVGTGPYQLDHDASILGSKWVWKKNTNYWQEGKPYLDEVHDIVIKDEATTYAAFKVGQVDIILQNITSLAAQQIAKDSPDAQHINLAAPSPKHVYMNSRQAPFTDPLVRKAMGYAIDSAEFVKVMTGGKGLLALSGGLATTFTEAEKAAAREYNPTKAKELLAQAGYTDGVKIPLIWPPSYGRVHQQMLELFQAQMKKGGINIELVALEKAEESSRKKSGDFVMTITGKRVVADIDSYLAVFLPGKRSNYHGTDDPVLTQLIADQRAAGDPASRQEIIRKAILHINGSPGSANECCPHAFALYHDVTSQFASPAVRDYYPHWGNLGVRVREVWLAK